MSLRGPKLELVRDSTRQSILLPSAETGSLQHRLGDAGVLASNEDLYDLEIGSYFWDCFSAGANITTADKLAQRIGEGAGNTIVVAGNLNSSSLGVVLVATGNPDTVAGTGYSGLSLGSATSSIALAGGAGLHTYAARFSMPSLSTATEEYVICSGFAKNVLGTAMDSGAWFVYDRVGASQGAVASNNWQCICGNGTARTGVVTSVAVPTNVMQVLAVQINGITGVATFFIDDLLVATISTNVPTANTAAARFGWVTKIQKTVGANSRALRLDYVYWKSSYLPGGTPAARVIP